MVSILKSPQRFIQELPHAKALGMQFSKIGSGSAEMYINYDKKFIGDPESGVVHGGVIFALLDSCCGAAVLCHKKHVGRTATIDLRVDYMRPATPDQTIIARAKCYKVTRSVAFVKAAAFDEDEEKPMATAVGAFMSGA